MQTAMLGDASEALAQVLLLRSDPDRAIVGVADPSHDATLSDHGDRPEPILFRAEQSSDHDVPAGFQTSISTQQNPIAQTVFHQGAMHLGEAKFPWTAGVLDRTQGRCARAPVVAGDLNHIRVGLRHARSDGANADLGHQLHAHRSSRMHLVQIMNQLRQVLNGIDVVVRRRRNQGHPGLAVAQPGDVLVDLRPRQLPPFTGLGPLGHLDLQLFATAQVFSRHTETP